MTLNVIFREFREDEETYFVAECPELPGCISQGATYDEARVNIMEAIKLCMDVVLEDSMHSGSESTPPDSENVVSRSRLHVTAETELEYA